MQSMAAIRSLRLLPLSRTCLLPLARASTTPYRTADPALHSQHPEADEDLKASEQKKGTKQDHQNPTANDPTEPVKTPPFASSPKLESTGAGPTPTPTFQQKRRLSQSASAPSLDDVACIGADGRPLIDGEGSVDPWESAEGDEREEKERIDDYREYYEEHKASPLAEIEIADTRLPISRASDGEKRDDLWGGEGRGYYIEDTVDDSLRRAEEMFNAARERGDPTMPHSRALMRMLHQRYEQQQM